MLTRRNLGHTCAKPVAIRSTTSSRPLSAKGTPIVELPAEVRLCGNGVPPRVKTVEQAIALIDNLPAELAQLPRWTFARALLVEVMSTKKSRDMNTAVRQLKQALRNEHWLDESSSDT
jgi:hypothetical protein